MKVITALDTYEKQEDDILCFLAGGITNCHDWQSKVIEFLEELNLEKLVIFNPQRKDFPIGDPNAAEEQIKWEFEWLNQADIFSMYFCNSDSVQPICFYELGRHMKRMADIYSADDIVDHVLVSVEDGYKRERDVVIQTKLAANREHDPFFVHTQTDPYDHARRISLQYKLLTKD